MLLRLLRCAMSNALTCSSPTPLRRRKHRPLFEFSFLCLKPLSWQMIRFKEINSQGKIENGDGRFFRTHALIARSPSASQAPTPLPVDQPGSRPGPQSRACDNYKRTISVSLLQLLEISTKEREQIENHG
jgi:hypothetical protein